MKAEATRRGGRWVQRGENAVIDFIDPAYVPDPGTPDAPLRDCLDDRSRVQLAVFCLMHEWELPGSAGEMRK